MVRKAVKRVDFRQFDVWSLAPLSMSQYGVWMYEFQLTLFSHNVYLVILPCGDHLFHFVGFHLKISSLRWCTDMNYLKIGNDIYTQVVFALKGQYVFTLLAMNVWMNVWMYTWVRYAYMGKWMQVFIYTWMCDGFSSVIKNDLSYELRMW